MIMVKAFIVKTTIKITSKLKTYEEVQSKLQFTNQAWVVLPFYRLHIFLIQREIDR